MIRLTINLPTRYRLDLNIVKSRKITNEPFLPNLKEIRRVKKGNKISRYFRHIFEHQKIRQILGTNLVLAVFATTYIGPISKPVDLEQTIIPENELPLIISTEESTRYPVENVKITQGYSFYHPAYDLDGITGDPIYPVRPGYIRAAGYSNVGYGNTVIVDHGSGTISLYAHLSKIIAKPGQTVNTRDIIGEMGATGKSFGDHLHLEIRKDGIPVNPATFLGK